MGYRAENLLRMFKSASPTLIGVFGVILLALPLRLFEGLVPTPIIPLVVVYFWTIYGPDIMPSVSVFLIGLAQDLLTGGPLGLWAGVYLVVQLIVLSQRAYFAGREQKVVWLGFAMAAIAAGLLVWLIKSLMSGALLPVSGIVVQLAVTAAIYPVFAMVFGEFHRRVLVEV